MESGIPEATLTVESFLREASDRVNSALDRFLPREDQAPTELHRAVRYSVFAGGKRLRPALCLASFDACGGKGEEILYAAAALEMTHTFSLIHDDLPSMDNDDFRRGRPTNHKVFGEAMAILAGDSLLVYAFELLAKAGNVGSMVTMAQSLGMQGMLGGQVLDIQSEGKAVGLDTVESIHRQKTAALIAGSLVMGAQIAGAPHNVVEGLRNFGMKIGLAFQIVDDVLDLEQTTESLGKDAKSDLARGKATYPSVIGIEASKEKAFSLVQDAIAELRSLPVQPTVLEQVAQYITTRVH